MTKRLLVRGARQIVTLRGPSGARRGAEMRNLAIVQSGAMLVEDGKIAHVGPAARIENLAGARQAEEVDATGCVILPGFVDCHTHMLFPAARTGDYEARLAGKSYEEIAAGGGGILSTVRQVRAASVRSLRAAAVRNANWMLSQGTTTAEVKSGYGLDRASELRMLRAIDSCRSVPVALVATCLGAHAVPPEHASNADGYVDTLVETLLPAVAQKKLARFADVYCDRNAFTVGQARRYLEAARALGLGIKVHASQFANLGAVQMACELGAVSVDHLERIGAREVELLARSATVATLLPGSVFHLGSTAYAPARALIDAGAAVALATDFNPGSSPTPSMPMVMSLACAQMRMTPAEAVTAATVNSAAALGLAGRAGVLEAGRAADFTVFRVPDYREIPYYFGAPLLDRVYRAGAPAWRR